MNNEMMDVRTASRNDLECAIIEYEIMPCDRAGLAAMGTKTTEELRAIVTAWVEAGDECER